MRVVNFSSCFCVLMFFAWRFVFGWRCQLLRPWSALFFGSWFTRIPSENFFTSYCILHFIFIIVFFVCFYFFVYFTNKRWLGWAPYCWYVLSSYLLYFALEGVALMYRFALLKNWFASWRWTRVLLLVGPWASLFDKPRCCVRLSQLSCSHLELLTHFEKLLLIELL